MSVSFVLAERLERLEARAEIAELMQRYAAAADAKYTPARERRPDAEVAEAARRQSRCFTRDAQWIGGAFGGTLEGREAIAAFFRRSPWRFTAHHYGCASMQVELDTARVAWRLLEIGVREDGATMLLTGTLHQTCRRVPEEGWLIARMAFESLHGVPLGQDALRCLIPLGESP